MKGIQSKSIGALHEEFQSALDRFHIDLKDRSFGTAFLELERATTILETLQVVALRDYHIEMHTEVGIGIKIITVCHEMLGLSMRAPLPN